MSGCIERALERFQVEKLQRPKNSPHAHTSPIYGRKIQMAEEDDDSPLIDKEQKKYVQAVTGTLLYYVRAVNPTILVALSSIAAQQAAPTQETTVKKKRL